MTLRTQIDSALASFGQFSGGSQPLAAAVEGISFQANLTALDQLAVAFSEFTVSHERLAAAQVERLKQTAEKLARRLTYLLEPVSPIEVDPEQCVIQLRSNPPQRDDTSSTYYEILVRRGGHISLMRYQKPRGQERIAVPALVTREVFLRLADDFAAVD
jgi:hypothetical protein